MSEFNGPSIFNEVINELERFIYGKADLPEWAGLSRVQGKIAVDSQKFFAIAERLTGSRLDEYRAEAWEFFAGELTARLNAWDQERPFYVGKREPEDTQVLLVSEVSELMDVMSLPWETITRDQLHEWADVVILANRLFAARGLRRPQFSEQWNGLYVGLMAIEGAIEQGWDIVKLCREKIEKNERNYDPAVVGSREDSVDAGRAFMKNMRRKYGGNIPPNEAQILYPHYSNGGRAFTISPGGVVVSECDGSEEPVYQILGL